MRRPDRTERTAPLRAHRLTEAAALLPLFALLAFTPPLVELFDVPVTVLGVPLLFAYMFSAWLGLILVGLAIAHGLKRRVPAEDEEGAPTGPV